MKFSAVVNMARFDPSRKMDDVADEALEIVKICDQGGFDIVWTAEHHTIELTISPNPFQILAHWAAFTSNVRLGTAVIAAPYWHPIRLAGEAGMCDVLTGGRLELGLGRGSYQYEFDRMAGGLPQGEGGRYLREIIPAVQALWQGDYEHNGEIWQFPSTASVPKPLQKAPPMWIAARDPNTFEFALKNNCSIMSTALRRPISEVESLVTRFKETQTAVPGSEHLEHATLRHAAIYDDDIGRDEAVRAAINFGRNFENMFKGIGTVQNGFPEPVNFDVVANRDEYHPDALTENLLFGTPEEIIARIERYEALGINHVMLGAAIGMSKKRTLRSMELFCQDVIPYFRTKEMAA